MRRQIVAAAMLASACAGGEDVVNPTDSSTTPGPGVPGAPGGPASASPSPPPASPAPAGGELAIASTLPAQCAGPEIFRVDRAVASNDKAKGHYSYGFRFKPPSTAGAPVLVYLPGGPGITSIDGPPTFLPSGWGYLLTDPRGVGCNTLAAIPPPDVASAFFRTEEIAGDVAAAIDDRTLDNFILYGHSYGTTLGTTLAHMLDAKGGRIPQAVVLEGVLGKAFGSDFVGAEFLHQWSTVHAAILADVRTELDTAPAPYGLSPVDWAHALNTLLYAGPDLVTTALDALVVGPLRDQELTQLRTVAKPVVSGGDGTVALLRGVACREISDTLPSSGVDVVFSHGMLVRNLAEEGTMCAGVHVSAPYDSAKLQYAAKTYYFIGEDDVAAPPWQGAYHFDHHTGHAVRVVTHGGGHLSLQLNQVVCAPLVLSSIAGGGTDLRLALATCPSAVDIDEK